MRSRSPSTVVTRCAVFSYYEKPGVMFSTEERVGFYGRAA